jgi:hypothetical protein
VTPIEELKNRINSFDIQIEAIRVGRDKLNAKMLRLDKKRQKLREDLDQLIFVANTTEDDDWGFLLTTFPETDVKHKALEAAVGKYGLGKSGYWLETRQSVVQLMLYRDDIADMNRQIEGLKRIIPHLTPFEVGSKRIKIFEDTLSANGSYSLFIWPDRYEVAHTRYGHDHVKKTTATLEEIVDYIRINHWYEEGKRHYAQVEQE